MNISELKKHKFIVIGYEHYNPLGVIRSLGENGIRPIVIMLKDDVKIASMSKYVGKLYFVKNNDQAYQLLLKKYGREEYKPFVIPCDDNITELPVGDRFVTILVHTNIICHLLHSGEGSGIHTITDAIRESVDMTIDMVVPIESSTGVVFSINLDAVHLDHRLVLDRDEFLVTRQEFDDVMVSPEEKDTPVQFGHILHILLDVILVGKHKVPAMNHNTIFRYHCIPSRNEMLIHLASTLEWSVAVLADVEMSQMSV